MAISGRLGCTACMASLGCCWIAKSMKDDREEIQVAAVPDSSLLIDLDARFCAAPALGGQLSHHSGAHGHLN